MSHKRRHRQIRILSVLRTSERSLSSSEINNELHELGYESSDRTVRLYLQRMEQEGLSKSIGRRGHRITEKGIAELDSSRTMERVGFLSARIDGMTFGMDFDLTNRSGTVVINTTIVKPEELAKCVDLICKVYEQGYAMGQLLALLEPGDRTGCIIVPEAMVGIGTVCSISLNGMLLKYGIPTNSRFGGLLELRDRKPIRFAEIITYDGTSIDPLEIFIRSGMTDYIGAIKTGNGRIGASFREFPAESRELVEELAGKSDAIGLGGFVHIGRPSQPLLEIPVSDGRVGAIVIGGLNPVAVLEETGIRAHSRAMAGLISFNRLFHYEELASRVRCYL
ncbi:MAG: NrpR regulatory domain-containing protein [Chloroflexota bacterium]|nr:NrpR regulatory domain-containing protein [Chloroflexota bacterium]